MNADELVRLLDELAVRLDGPARYTFELVVRQVYIEAVVWGLFGLLLIVPLATIPRAIRWSNGGDQYSDRGFAVWFYIVPVVLGALLGAILVGISLIKVFNPEFAALQRIAGMLMP